jgi:aryl-alcohol dehydrogenase-like predicted oxidoreductase
MLWGPTTSDECVATVHAAVAAGINLHDLAPRYGDGNAEQVVSEAFGGQLPAGLRVTSKCNLGNPPPRRDRHATAVLQFVADLAEQVGGGGQGKSSRVKPSSGTTARLIRVSASSISRRCASSRVRIQSLDASKSLPCQAVRPFSGSRVMSCSLADYLAAGFGRCHLVSIEPRAGV